MNENLIMNRDTELRKLSMNLSMELCHILEENESWKMLMSHIPHDTIVTAKKYTHPQINQIRDHAIKSKKTGAQVLFDEWGTSGKKRPTLGFLQDLLVDIELYRAADFISENILGGERCPRLENSRSPPPVIMEVGLTAEPMCVPYSELEEACHWLDGESAVLLGSGAFGDVYLGHLPQFHHSPLAIKKLQLDPKDKQFFTELNTLSRYRHENVVQLVGYSYDGPCLCLMYEFMSNGSLQDRLACLDAPFWECRSPAPIPWNIRVRIAEDIARGLVYLHTFDTPVVHRDVKTANILLDKDFRAKLGDFGLAWTGENNHEESASMTCAAGTSAYMAPEMHMGEITILGDTFSYGVVLLELLTSLPPTDKNRESWDLILHVENCCEKDEDISPLLDLKAGNWGGPNHPHASTLYDIAKKCHKEKEDRPYMYQLLPQLEAITNIL